MIFDKVRNISPQFYHYISVILYFCKSQFFPYFFFTAPVSLALAPRVSLYSGVSGAIKCSCPARLRDFFPQYDKLTGPWCLKWLSGQRFHFISLRIRSWWFWFKMKDRKGLITSDYLRFRLLKRIVVVFTLKHVFASKHDSCANWPTGLKNLGNLVGQLKNVKLIEKDNS